MTDLPLALPFRMDTRVLLASLALAMLSALLCGLAPALQSTRVDLVNGIKSAEVDVPGTQTDVGPKCPGGGAGFHLADAADRGLPDGAGFPARLAGRNQFPERPSADDDFRSAPGAVQPGSDPGSSTNC